MATTVQQFLKANPGYVGRANVSQKPKQEAPKKTTGRGGILSSLISEGSAAGGAAIGGAIGSAVPGIGTLIGAGVGGLIGGFGGRLAENKVRDDRVDAESFKQAGIEGGLSGALSALGAGMSALKGAKALNAAAGKSTALKSNLKMVGNLGQLSREEYKALTSGSRAGAGLLRKSTIADKSSIDSYSKQQELVKLATKFPELKGSGMNKFKNVEQVINRLNNEVTEKIAKSGVSVDSNIVVDRISQVGKMIADPLEAKKFKIAWDGLVSKELGKKATSGKISLSDLNTLSRGLNRKLSSAFKKINTGGTLTSSEEALLMVRQGLDDVMGEYAPKAVRSQVKNLNKQQSILLEGIPEFKRLSEQSLQIFGTKIPFVATGGPRAVQAGSDIAGRALNKVGSAGGALGSVSREAVRQSPANLYGAMSGAMTVPVEDPQQYEQTLGELGISEQDFGGTGDMMNNQMNNQMNQPQELYPAANMMQDIQNDFQTTGGKNVEKYLSLYKALAEISGAQGGGTTKLNVTKPTSEKFANASSGMNSLNQYEQLLASDPNILTRSAVPGRGLPIVGGYIAGATGTGESDALAYDMMDNLLRIRTGAQANPAEIKQYVTKMLPRAGDSQQTVERKLRIFRNTFGEILDLAGSQQNTGTDIASIIQQLGGM